MPGPPGVPPPSIPPSSARPARRDVCIAATSATLGVPPLTENQNLHAPVDDTQTPSSQSESPLLRRERRTYQCCPAVLPAASEGSELVTLRPAPKSSSTLVDASSSWSLTMYQGRGGIDARPHGRGGVCGWHREHTFCSPDDFLGDQHRGSCDLRNCLDGPPPEGKVLISGMRDVVRCVTSPRVAHPFDVEHGEGLAGRLYR